MQVTVNIKRKGVMVKAGVEWECAVYVRNGLTGDAVGWRRVGSVLCILYVGSGVNWLYTV